ncbi:hypothetical protein EYF80_067478 [Liparis tanakae]|uniref:Uncharacterized protein n=1 Tax=Liparis tanakae TaxID=230148 RepID=A0A4Z2E122_9TELE|nr:hypothetical protein EYF80_067478 [Liparis tanakae]
MVKYSCLWNESSAFWEVAFPRRLDARLQTLFSLINGGEDDADLQPPRLQAPPTSARLRRLSANWLSPGLMTRKRQAEESRGDEERRRRGEEETRRRGGHWDQFACLLSSLPESCDGS